MCSWSVCSPTWPQVTSARSKAKPVVRTDLLQARETRFGELGPRLVCALSSAPCLGMRTCLQCSIALHRLVLSRQLEACLAVSKLSGSFVFASGILLRVRKVIPNRQLVLKNARPFPSPGAPSLPRRTAPWRAPRSGPWRGAASSPRAPRTPRAQGRARGRRDPRGVVEELI